MVKRIGVNLLYLFLILAVPFAFSDDPEPSWFYNSNQLYGYCREQEVGFNLGVCAGDVLAVFGAISVAQNVPRASKSFCSEQSIMAGTWRKNGTTFTAGHSPERPGSATSAITATFRRTFSCPPAHRPTTRRRRR